MIRAAICVTPMLWAGAASAQTASEVARLIAAIEDAGCVVTALNESAVLQASGLTEQTAMSIVSLMMADGRAVPQDDDLRLTTGKCN